MQNYAVCQTSLILDSIGGKVIFTEDYMYFYGDAISKVTYDGNILWKINLPFTISKLIVSPDAFYGLKANRLWKIDTLGNVRWVKKFDVPVNPASTDTNVVGDVVFDGKYLYLSSIQSPPQPWGAGPNIFPSVIKLDTSGSVLNVAADHKVPGGGFYLQPCAPSLKSGAWFGYDYQPGFTHSSYLMKIDSSGNFDLASYIPSFFFSTVTYLHSVIPLKDSCYLAITYSWSYNAPIAFFTLSKFNESGVTLWQNSYFNNLSTCSTVFSEFRGADSDSAGNIYVIGNAAENYCPIISTGGIFCMKLDSMGNILFIKGYSSLKKDLSLGSVHYKSGYLYAQTSYHQRQALLVFDSSFSNSCYDPDSTIILQKISRVISQTTATYTPPVIAYLPATDSISAFLYNNGSSSDLCLTLSDKVVRNEIESLRLFPNPTTGKLKIENEKLKIETVHAYNLFGKEIMTTHSTDEIDLSPFPAGMYVVEVSGKDFLWRGKVLKTNN